MAPTDHTNRSVSPATGTAHSRSAIVLTALAASLLGYGWTLRGHFLADDFGYVGRFFELPWAQWPRLFVESWAGGIWGFELRELRPVTALSFMFDARCWGGNAVGFRITNLILHVVCTSMVGAMAWRVCSRSVTCGVAAAILFGLHPVHAEPVQWITGRVDVLTTTFYLAGFLTFVRYREQGGLGWVWATGVLYALAAFSKEFGLMLPGMFLVADLVWFSSYRRWREWRTWAPYMLSAVVFIVYFFCRRAAFGGGGMGAGLPDFTSLAFYTQLAERQLTYLCYLFLPASRWPHFGASLVIPNALQTFALIVIPAVAAIALWTWTARWRPIEERRAFLFFGLGWYVVATLPLIVTYISARHLYLASAGVCIALTVIAHGLLRWRVGFVVVMMATALLFGQRLSAALRPWHEAAMVSGRITQELLRLEADAAPGAALFLDVPEIISGAYGWTWAVPFALRPPFTRERLDLKLVVLESRGLYVDWVRWHEQPAVAGLQQVQVPSWILQAIDGRAPQRIAVPAEKVRVAAATFARGPAKEQPHETWRKLINELTAP